jgi:uncharacterized circularly permuted ATP-grasp superfamily protein/uncharacterized alpha-E superfamily protein
MTALLRDYRPTGGRHDAAVDAGGAPRPGWAGVLAGIDRLGPDELVRRQRAADRLVQAEGAGVLLHDDTSPRAVGVGVVPLVLGDEVWSELAAGLAQRAELLQAIWRDLNGPCELLRAGVVPIEALATHPAFPLSPAGPPAARVRTGSGAGPGRPGSGPGPGRGNGQRQIEGQGFEQPLVLVGADLVVDANGRFLVARDLTDVANGDGQALLARSIVSRVLPPSDHPVDLVGHDSYARELRTHLARVAPAGRTSPRTVVLTGPPDEPGYVENAYLATQLGYSLAEPADVVVRGGRAWLRSLDGPEPIDVLLRRISEIALDPVQQRHLGTGGVAGLVEAARGRGVSLVNPHGAALVGHLALQPFLDAACQFLLGTGLKLPSVPTLWCGDPEHLAEVRAAPGRFVLHDTDPLGTGAGAGTGVDGGGRNGQGQFQQQSQSQGHSPTQSQSQSQSQGHGGAGGRGGPGLVAGSGRDRPGVADWLSRIEARPERYVAQLGVPLATAPCLVGRELQGRPVALRTQVLLAATGPQVFPGGHARVIGDDEYGDHGASPAVLTAATATAVGAGTAGSSTAGTGVDVWVLEPEHRPRSQQRPRARTTVPAIPQVDLRRSLPTQAAEAMYWTGRTAERAEMGARTALICLTRVINGEPRPADLLAMIDGLRAMSGGMLGPSVEATTFDLEAEVRSALSGRPASVVGNLRATVTTARAARPMLSERTWRLLALLDAEAAALDKLAGEPGLAAFDATEVLDRVLVPLAALSGLTGESVMRTAAWRFLDVGRRLERALLVLGLLEATLDPRTDEGAPDPFGASVPWDPLDNSDPLEGSLRLEATLAACECLVAYRRSFRSDVTRAAVGNLLLADPANPRSVQFQLDQLAVDLNDLPDRPVRRLQMAALRKAARALDGHISLGIGPLVLAVRAPLLEIGELMASGWFSEPHRRAR